MRAPAPVLVLLAAFWVGILTAGRLLDGYSDTASFMSALAARTSSVWELAVLALLCLALAHVLTGLALLRHSLLTGGLVMAAGLSLVGVAFLRASCPKGPIGCGLGRSFDLDPVDWFHGTMVGYYLVLQLAAMAALAGYSYKRHSDKVGTLSLLLLLASLVMFAGRGEYTGLWQRLWVLVNSGWLVVALAVTPRIGARARQVVAR